MAAPAINRQNVGRIAERIVSNEFEYRGFRVSDLNKEGASANADLLIAKSGKTWQVQVKGATEDRGWWFNYGYSNEAVIRGTKPMFNSAESFYVAHIVVLVCVKTPSEYCCVVLPVKQAEEAAQLNLAHSYRIPNANGSAKKPGPVFVSLGYIPRPRNKARLADLEKEQEMLKPFVRHWNIEEQA